MLLLSCRARHVLCDSVASSSDRLLHDAAAVLMTRNLRILCNHSVVDELPVDWLPRLEDLLQHMVAVDILGEQPDLVFQEGAEVAHVLRQDDHLDDLLNGASTMHRLAELDRVRSNRVDHRGYLGFGTNLDQLLGEVVAEGVVHELRKVLNCAVEDGSRQLFIILADLLLEEATAALILRQFSRVARYQVEYLRSVQLIVAF